MFVSVRGFARRFALLLLATACVAPPLRAQQVGSIIGRVTDASTLRPLEGAQLSLVNTRLGVLSRSDGRYLIPGVPPGTHTLEVRFIGYASVTRPVTIAAGQTVTADIELNTTAIGLDEVVVTGTAVATQRRQLGATVASVAAEAIQSAPVSNLSEALVGRVTGMLPGVASDMGSSPTIVLRGGTSLSQRNQPLVYIDGVRVDNTFSQTGSAHPSSTLDQINPDDIERVEVIKGAAAATLFGTEASNGVIQLFTKRGTVSAPQYSVNVTQELTRVPFGRIPPNWAYDPATKKLYGPDNPIADYLTPLGHAQNYDLSVRGGSTSATYFASIRVADEVGPQDREIDSAQNQGLRTGLTFQATEKLSARIDLNGIRTERRVPGGKAMGAPGTGYLWVLWLATPNNPVPDYPYGGRYRSLWGDLQWPPPAGYHGPLPHDQLPYPLDGPLLFGRKSKLESNRLTVSTGLTYDWSQSLRSDLTFGRDRVTDENVEQGIRDLDRTAPDGYRAITNEIRTQTTLDFKTSWQREINQKLTSTLVIGGQSFWQSGWSRSYGTWNFSSAELSTLGGGSQLLPDEESFTEVINAGMYAQEQVGINNRLFLTGGLRLDGNSAFGQDFGLALYPKAGVSWVLSDESFWPFQNTFRFHAAVGAAGLQPGAFDAQQTWQPVSRVTNSPAVIPQNKGNPNLKAERSVEREVGVETDLLRGRIGVELVYFNTLVTDALLPAPTPPSNGFTTTQLTNLGKLKSQGVEAGVNVTWVQRRGFRFSTDFQGAWHNAKVLSMGGVPAYRIEGGRYYQTIKEGYAPGAWIGPTVDPKKPYNLAVPIDQLTKLSQITPNVMKNSVGSDSLSFKGNSTPTWTGSVAPAFDLPGGFKLRSLFTGAYDYYVIHILLTTRLNVGNDERAARYAQALDNPATTTAERQKIADWWGTHHPANPTQNFLRSDNVRFQELSLDYEVPQSIRNYLASVNSLSISLTARNLWLWNSCADCVSDPFVSRGGGTVNPDGPGRAFFQNADYGNAPAARRFGINVRAAF